MCSNPYKYSLASSKTISESKKTNQFTPKMKCFAALFVAIFAATLVGANPPGSPAEQPKAPANVLPNLINYIINLFANVKTLLQYVLHGLASAVNYVLQILIFGLLRLLLLLAPGNTLVPVSALCEALSALKTPNVVNIGGAVIGLLDAQLAGSVILYILPKPIADTVVDINSLTAQVKGLGKESVPLSQLIDILGNCLLGVYGLKL